MLIQRCALPGSIVVWDGAQMCVEVFSCVGSLKFIKNILTCLLFYVAWGASRAVRQNEQSESSIPCNGRLGVSFTPRYGGDVNRILHYYYKIRSVTNGVGQYDLIEIQSAP